MTHSQPLAAPRLPGVVVGIVGIDGSGGIAIGPGVDAGGISIGPGVDAGGISIGDGIVGFGGIAIGPSDVVGIVGFGGSRKCLALVKV